ncbi:hypothetical protein Mapa_016953 [Marchantia paleacea]|nr:hypothetical protein Mapa_016953 [Marchantia paleacea]
MRLLKPILCQHKSTELNATDSRQETLLIHESLACQKARTSLRLCLIDSLSDVNKHSLNLPISFAVRQNFREPFQLSLSGLMKKQSNYSEPGVSNTYRNK